MAENLAYKPSSGMYWAYDNEFSNVSKYGYLYDWETACKVCPDGWHLPSDEEWKQLEMQLGMSRIAADSKLSRGTNEGDALKSSSKWNGNNSSGFSALPGGLRFTILTNESFYDKNSHGHWWSSTESGTEAWRRLLNSSHSNIHRYTIDKVNGVSVRCIRN